MIIGKSLTALGGGGLKPEIRVTALAGALLNLHYKDSTIILQTYQLGAEETQHTFVVNVSETAYVVEDVTNGKSVEVLVDAVAVFNVKMKYKLFLYNLGDECTSVTGGWTSGSKVIDNYHKTYKFYNSADIDFTPYSTIHFDISASSATGLHAGYGYPGTANYYDGTFIKITNPVPTKRNEYILDVTSLGITSMYVGVIFDTSYTVTPTFKKDSDHLTITCKNAKDDTTKSFYIYRIWVES